jgi:hypothetical protein
MGSQGKIVALKIYIYVFHLFPALWKVRQKQTTLSIFTCHKVEIQYLSSWQCFLAPINKEIYKNGLIFIIYIVIESEYIYFLKTQMTIFLYLGDFYVFHLVS